MGIGERRKQKKGGQRKHGRCLRKASKMNYVTRGQRKINKLKRVLQSNGDAAHRRYKRDAHHRGNPGKASEDSRPNYLPPWIAGRCGESANADGCRIIGR